jgi:anthranilate phosphoribosyltransferase
MTSSMIDRIENGLTFSRSEAEAVMDELLTGGVPTEEIVRLLTALNSRPYQLEEIVGFALAMRRRAAPVFTASDGRPSGLLDTCGTGGAHSGAFNISTAAAIVACAAGGKVAKHGNRSSKALCGSADVLEALGIPIDVAPEKVARSIRDIGFGFIFARRAHVSMRHAVAARQQIGVRTVFNLLGPLTNPAGAEAQVVGVFSAEVIDLVAAALVQLGVKRAFVVHGADGLGEISLSGETFVAELRDGDTKRYAVAPETFEVSRAPLQAISGGNASENAEIIRRVFAGEPGPRRDIVVVNAAAALVACARAQNFREGSQMANEAISSGKAAEKLAALIAFANCGSR